MDRVSGAVSTRGRRDTDVYRNDKDAATRWDGSKEVLDAMLDEPDRMYMHEQCIEPGEAAYPRFLGWSPDPYLLLEIG